MRRFAILAVVLATAVVSIDAAQRWYRTDDGFVMGGRRYTLGVDYYCCGKSSCSMQRDLWAAYQRSQTATTPQQVTAALAVAKESFAPTPTDAVDALWTVIRPRAGEIVMDPGCGDARILVAASQRFGAKGIGIEINPETASKAIRNVASAGLDKHISITRGDCRAWSFGSADYLVLYLYNDLIREIDHKIRNTKPGALVVSYLHPLPDSFVGQQRLVRGEHVFYLWENTDNQ